MPNVGSVIDKDPNAYLAYEVDWSAWLGSDVLTNSEWFIAGPDSTLTADTYSILTGSQITRVWLLGGTAGNTYSVTNRITVAGTPVAKDDRSFFVSVVER